MSISFKKQIFNKNFTLRKFIYECVSVNLYFHFHLFVYNEADKVLVKLFRHMYLDFIQFMILQSILLVEFLLIWKAANKRHFHAPWTLCTQIYTFIFPIAQFDEKQFRILSFSLRLRKVIINAKWTRFELPSARLSFLRYQFHVWVLNYFSNLFYLTFQTFNEGVIALMLYLD